MINKFPPHPLASLSSTFESSKQETLSNLFPTFTGISKSSECNLTTTQSNFNPSTSNLLENSLDHPGLLQMLLNAEKSQELIWSSVRCSSLNQPLSSNCISYLPNSIKRVFEESSATASTFIIPSLFSNNCSMMSNLGLLSISGTNELNENELKTHLARNASISHLSNPLTNLASQLTLSHWDSVQEITARLLFMVIHWIKSLPTFQTLSNSDQVR